MLDSLSQRLSKIVKTMRGQARLTEENTKDMLREVRIALLEADVALPVVREVLARIKEKPWVKRSLVTSTLVKHLWGSFSVN